MTQATTNPAPVILELREATKKYGGVPAVDGVDFQLAQGEIHALLGENGAGKSTLTKIMAGVVRLSAGRMLVEGREVDLETPLQARDQGIAMVFQETSLVPTMTVAQNLFLGQEKFFNRLRGIYIAAQQFLQSLNFDVDPTTTVSALGAAKKQMVEIARAVLHKARIIIFDEPTASLTPEEKKYFFDLVFNLKQRGVSVIFISHALEEALLLADRITVMRDGKHVVTDLKQNFDRARIVQAMVGRDLSQTLYGQKKAGMRPQGECVLQVRNLRMASMVKNNSLSVFTGQVTGVFGLVGAGRTETFKVVSGLIKRDFFHGGEVLLRGRPVRYRVPRQAVADGIAYITEDRKIEGFFETMSISDNVYMGAMAKADSMWGPVQRRIAGALGEKWIRLLNVRAISRDVKVIELSGGNQQKVVIAKSLVQEPDLIIFDEPTRGVDVGAIAEIHAEIGRLADAGKAVVVISSYLPEIMALSDRILVAKQGKVVVEFSAQEATQESIMYAAIH
ncbi:MULTISPECIES: sugar ABC transporter ATP-binding protein [Ramlibacter]|uniref:Sugar ABC transporter ATP-binding protein n=1 Tax=Ramlibacter aquaticus TaxID=2780094 RepID=A0ABR9SBW1_9BURK|nr:MULTISPECIES: sugar ABC transporter ATP-binding protein [Ramlibacter]MBE7939704.1 sugar ABC transporter ATP-binding protein [Ramlibacter aquaticus]